MYSIYRIASPYNKSDSCTHGKRHSVPAWKNKTSPTPTVVFECIVTVTPQYNIDVVQEVHKATRTCLTLAVSCLRLARVCLHAISVNAGLMELCNQKRQCVIPTYLYQEKKNIH